MIRELIIFRFLGIMNPPESLKVESSKPEFEYYSERHWKVVIARSEATRQSREIASLRSQ